MRRFINILGVLWLLLSCSNQQKAVNKPAQEGSTDTITIKQSLYPEDEVRVLISAHFTPPDTLLNSSAGKLLQTVYELHNNQAFWTNKNLVEQGFKLLNNARFHGISLNPKNINALYEQWLQIADNNFINAGQLAKFDITFTNQLILLAQYLYYGKTNPVSAHPNWNFPPKPNPSFDLLLYNFLQKGNIANIETAFEPHSKAYHMLKKELTRRLLDTIPGTKNYIKYPGKVYHPGDSNIFIYQLKKHLQSKGVVSENNNSYKFDTELLAGIKKIQQMHGLITDGVAGKNTYEVLNWPRQKYIDLLKINLERLRWLPDMPASYLFVNIPAYQLYLMNNQSMVFNSRVIVGRVKNQTPVIYSEINYMVFNPSWTVPYSIASEKMLPHLKHDSTYLDERNMFITLNGKKIDHHLVDFSRYDTDNFPFKIYQRADPQNALGKVKFMFRNNHSVYLHDTPTKHLFNKDIRAYSHGCVRVQKADVLSEILLQHNVRNSKLPWHYYSKGYPVKVYLNKKVPVFICYFTCYYDTDNNTVQFFNDIYGIDYLLLKQILLPEKITSK